ncbi:MAG: cation:proton antiporter [Flavobacteriales bacterium]|nr:cation:proton antiporter [Flavobacteriales bacterium]
MARSRNILFYLLVISAAVVLVFMVVQQGNLLGGPLPPKPSGAVVDHWKHFKDIYHENLTHPLAILLLQILTIIAVARTFGFICQKIGLPTVIGEIAAGIFLGPSFMAQHWPEYSAFLFPPASLGNLQFLSQIGLILFMFVVGMELDLNVLRDRASDALVVSHTSIVVPFVGAVALSYFLFPLFAPAGITFLSFALFMGIAMSIAAFPVMARIVQERNLHRTHFGSTIITFAAADDITAWSLLAVIIAIVKAGSLVSSLFTVVMVFVYLVVMFRVVRPFLRKLGDIHSDRDSLSKAVVAVFFGVLILSAYITEVLGVHALIGAFVAGVAMPPNIRFRTLFIEKVEDVALVLLLPLFFVFTGLRTEIGLLNNPGLWKWCGIILLVAVLGKFIGSGLAARMVGLNLRQSLMVGAFMNTRGLMELVVLNIGYDLGVIGPEIFAMMVVMALVTTVMTGPLLGLIERYMPDPEAARERQELLRRFRVLVPFGDPVRGRSMVRVAHALVRKQTNATITALHMAPSEAVHRFNMAERERESFEPIRREAKRVQMPLETVFKPAVDIDKEVVVMANEGAFDLAIMGVGRSIYEGTLLGRIVGVTSRIINPERLLETLTGKERLFDGPVFDDRVRTMVRDIKVPLGLYVEKGLDQVAKCVVPISSHGESYLLTYVQKLILNSDTEVVLLDSGAVFEQNPELLTLIRTVEQESPGKLVLRRSADLFTSLMQLPGQDLMLVGIDTWTKAVQQGEQWLSLTPSVLILRH